MTLSDLVLSALAKADEEPGEEIFEEAIKKGINHAYMIVATTLEPQLEATTLVMDTNMALPKDFFKIDEIRVDGQKLSTNDYKRVGDVVRITNRDYNKPGTEYELDYYKFPKLLIDDSDVPVISEPRQLVLIDYGAYECLLLKKKYDAAAARLNSFMRAIGGDTNNES